MSYLSKKLEQSSTKDTCISTALNDCPQGVVIIDNRENDFEVLYFNNRFEKMLRLDPEKIETTSIIDLFSKNCTCVNTEECEFISNFDKDNVNDFEIKQKIDGENYHYKLTLKEYGKDSTGKNNTFRIGILSDETAIRARAASMVQSQKLEALGQLAGGVAHDFNNIMSIIDGYARMIGMEAKDNEEIKSYSEKIMNAIKRGSSLTSQLLTFGRHKVVTETTIDIGTLAKENKTLLTPLLDAAITLDVYAQEGTYVDGEADSITQILINLVVNAKDAMPNGGNIKICVKSCSADDLPKKTFDKIVPKTSPDSDTNDKPEEETEYCFLRVTDTGEGIDEKTMEKIFDPFFTTKDQGKGTGLGLSMVYGIVEQMNGDTVVETSPGEGCNFTLYFPVSKNKPVKKISRIEGTDYSSLKMEGYKVLIAEDEPDLLELIAGMMEEMGMDVIRASNGNIALMKQEDIEGDIDFLLTDVVMPELDGVRLAELFQTERPDTKIIFMSGYPANNLMERIELPKGATLLAKPVEYNNLAYIMHSMASGDKDKEEELKSKAGKWSTQNA